MENSVSEAPQCLNCQEPLHGDYCHKCGQHHRVYVRSIFAVLGDLMGELGHWDSRFYRTLRGLFLRPGFLSAEFMQGRHASYVPPLRLYFFISLVAFIIFSATIDLDLRNATAQAAPNETATADVAVITAEDLRMDFPFLPEAEQQRINERLRYLSQNPNVFAQRIIQLTPQMMLLMLPFWALFLKLIYIFRRHYYLEHLTVALHTHGFILLSLMLAVIVAEFTNGLTTLTGLSWFSELGDWVDYAIFAWMLVYLLLTQKNFYQQKWPISVIKFLVSGIAYTFLLLSAFVLTVIYSVVSA